MTNAKGILGKISKNIYELLIHSFLILSVIFLVALVEENKSLRIKMESGILGNISEGEIFQNLLVTDMEENLFELELNKNEKETLLFIFTTTCRYCTEIIPVWKELYNEYKEKVEIYAISTSSKETLSEYIKINELPYRIVIPESKTFIKDYKINSVPQTFLIDKNGIVKRVLIGKLLEIPFVIDN